MKPLPPRKTVYVKVEHWTGSDDCHDLRLHRPLRARLCDGERPIEFSIERQGKDGAWESFDFKLKDILKAVSDAKV